MIRLGFYITLAILLALGAVWFADHPGLLQLNWQGWEVRMSVAMFILLGFLYTVLCWYLFKLYRWFRTDNPLMSPKRQASRREKGLAELDRGWSALSIHDKAAARNHGKKAQSLLPADNGPLRLLLKACTEKDQQKYLDKLNEDANSQMVALTFRLKKNLKDQNSTNACDILRQMHELNPENPWICKNIFDVSTRLGRWAEAAQKLHKLVKANVVTAHEQKHLAAALSHSQALEADIAGQKKHARDFAGQALKNDPGFVPAALLLARQYLADGNNARAGKVIERIWKGAAHPDLARFFLKLAPLESPSEKFRRIRKFADLNTDSPHSLHLRASVGVETEHWADAKQSLDKLVTAGTATSETFHLLARLERAQKQDEKAAAAHMARASNAAPDPTWHCTVCQETRENYTVNCPACHTFGGIRWP